MSNYICKWHKEMELFYRIKPILILEGNVLDLFEYPVNGVNMELTEYLGNFLHDNGYESVVRYDGINGFRDALGKEEGIREFAEMTEAQTEIHHGSMRMDFAEGEESACMLAKRLMTNVEKPSAVIFNMASRYILSADQLLKIQADAFTTLMMAGMEAAEVYANDRYLRNLCILIVDKVNDLPVWFYKDNPYAKTLLIQTPSREERMELVSGSLLRRFFAVDIYEQEIGEYEKNPVELEKIQERFVALTEGFTRLELCDLSCLCAQERYSIHELDKIVDLYRYGVKENPWTSEELRSRLKKGEELLCQRVKGQDAAMDKTLQVIKRAVSGLSGLQHSSHGKPKGILFFAGPTGTGKTEMAKSLAELIFGDERSCIRFDMSEYADASSDQRLLGAAPGYVGYEAGGQLTNAVREHPFSILLFDEIEKAHGTIMDKFLQILEDGRMTDGQGNTVYFSECVIIFTSNLGIYARDERTGRRELQVTAEEDYAAVEQKVKNGISDYFKLQLGRPEILNRIGENIVVFDFIRPDTARAIMDSQLNKITRTLRMENDVEVVITDAVREELYRRVCTNLENGGRGVGNIIEEVIINPLSGYMLDNDLLKAARITIEGLDCSSVPVKVQMSGEALV